MRENCLRDKLFQVIHCDQVDDSWQFSKTLLPLICLMEKRDDEIKKKNKIKLHYCGLCVYSGYNSLIHALSIAGIMYLCLDILYVHI